MKITDLITADNAAFGNGYEKVPVTEAYMVSLEHGRLCALFNHDKSSDQKTKDLFIQGMKDGRGLFFYQKDKNPTFWHKSMTLAVANERFGELVVILQKVMSDMTLVSNLEEKIKSNYSFVDNWKDEAVLQDFIFMKTGVDVSAGFFTSVWASHLMKARMSDLGISVPADITLPEPVLQKMEAAKGKAGVETYNRLVRLLYVEKENDAKALFLDLGDMMKKKILELAKSPFKERINSWIIQ